MIDALYARLQRSKDKILDPAYQPSDAITRTIFLNRNAKKLVVIFPGWHMHDFPSQKLIKRLSKRGWAVLFYDFHDQLLTADDEVVVESFRYVRDKIASDLHKITDEHNYEEVTFLGISLGNVVMSMVTDKFNKFDSAAFVVAGDDLAIDMWHGLRTSNYRDAFRKLHISMQKLSEEWRQEAPARYARNFAGKRIVYYMSVRDKFNLTKYQKAMVEKLQNAGADVKIIKSPFGHILTALGFCYLGKIE